jgi:hypothetical protein
VPAKVTIERNITTAFQSVVVLSAVAGLCLQAILRILQEPAASAQQPASIAGSLFIPALLLCLTALVHGSNFDRRKAQMRAPPPVHVATGARLFELARAADACKSRSRHNRHGRLPASNLSLRIRVWRSSTASNSSEFAQRLLR